MVLNWIHKKENLPVDKKKPIFACAVTPILLDKKQTDDQNQNIFRKILLKSMPFWPQPQSDECHFLSLKLSMLCYALMNFIVPYTNDMLPLQFMQRA